jgi:hypothetical protein
LKELSVQSDTLMQQYAAIQHSAPDSSSSMQRDVIHDENLPNSMKNL